jgi:hypothetical protein
MTTLPKKGGRVRPVSRATNFTSLRSCKCFKDMHKRLVEDGVSARIVAEWMQNERNEMTNMTIPSLVNLLNDYRMSIPAAQRAGPLNQVFANAVEEVKHGLDELDEMHRLYKIQMQRIEIDFQTEKNIKKLLPTMTQEIRTAREILSSASQLKMDLGIHQRQLGKVDVETTLMADVAERYADSPAVARVLDSGESRRKVLGLAERLLSIADRSERHPELVSQLERLAPLPEDVADAAVLDVTPELPDPDKGN